jgi:hypothetical protein
MQQLAKSRGGKCLSGSYKNARSKLLWECSEGHRWEAPADTIKNQGSWCKKCKGLDKPTMVEIQTFARNKGGQCLSKSYENAQAMLWWRCGEGHTWKTSWNKINSSGSWCPVCGIKKGSGVRRLKIEELTKDAEARGGRLLSATYQNAHQKLEWACAKGHKWSATANNVRSGQWCPICKLDTIAQKKRKYVIDDLHKLAKSRGGECLSDKFISTNRRYKWRCALGHEWCSSWGSVHLQRTWCPDCAKGLNERICRAYFEEAFGKPFPSVRNLDWLRTPEGHALELDGYCADLKMAFEHHGEQHYRDIRFLNSPQYDELKESLCEKYGVLLVIVPQLGTLLPHKALPSHIESVVRNSRQSCKKLPAFETVDLSGAYPLNPLEDLRQVAENRGGRCISDQYLGGHINLRWECSQGHQWETAPSQIKSGAWCPHCSGNARLTIEEMRSIAASKGGKCISRTYRNSSTKLTWECANGHRWKAVPSVVKNGSWCPHCSKNRPCSIDEFHKIACERKGKCLSTEYINNKTRLHFQCEHGHQWEAIPSNVKRGKWCPKCADKNRWNGRKPTIEDMQEIARVRGGQCISSAYISTRSKVRWQCAKSHQWEATPSNVKRGAWCPICARRR